jgi:dTDP-4-dehydrorhamnose reductase
VRALITGSSGQLGVELLKTAPHGIEVVGLSHSEGDITDPRRLEEAFGTHRPSVVINAAAYTDVDASETHPELAEAINATGAGNVARAATKVGARTIHISTDYVFDGRRTTPYTPDAGTNPLNVYGKTKLAGEKATLAESPAALIVRTAWLYAPTGKTFLTRTVETLRSGVGPKLIDDKWGSPTLSTDLAEVLWMCVTNQSIGGTYHFANAGSVSRYDIGCEIRRLLLQASPDSHLPDVIPVSTAEYKDAAPRPVHSALDSSALLRRLSLAPRDWKVALAEAMSHLPVPAN